MTKKWINVELDDTVIDGLESIAKNESRKRKQVIELLLNRIVEKKVKEKDLTTSLDIFS